MTEKDNEPMILEGDCIELMKEFDENTFDAIVTDPPYNLHFMGKNWDKDLLHEKWLIEAYRVLKPGASMLIMGGTRTFHRLMVAIEDSGFIIKDTLMWIYGSGFPKCQDITPHIDAKMLGITTKQVKERREIIGEKKITGCRPERENFGADDRKGGKGMGFRPGKIDITRPLTPLAKHWDGFKVGGIKPAYEPIVWAVKPPEGSYIDNVLKWGIGAVNVDECRVGTDENCKRKPSGMDNQNCYGKYKYPIGGEGSPKGRFPANVILSHHPECERIGVKKVRAIKGGRANQTTSDKYGEYANRWRKEDPGYGDKDGLETVDSWDCHPDCAIRIMDEQSGKLGNNWRKNKSAKTENIKKKSIFAIGDKSTGYHYDSGGASRFFYCAKASRGERNKGLEEMEEKLFGMSGGANQALKRGEVDYKQEHIGLNRIKKVKNNHPTVKPIKLFEYLIKLVTRKGQTIIDPFLGSGTTMIAANNVDRECVGIEREGEYIPIAEKRVEYWLKKREKND